MSTPRPAAGDIGDPAYDVSLPNHHRIVVARLDGAATSCTTVGSSAATMSHRDAPLADKINPVAVQAMAEEGIDITAEPAKILTLDAVKASDVVIPMGCGDTCLYWLFTMQGLVGAGRRR